MNGNICSRFKYLTTHQCFSRLHMVNDFHDILHLVIKRVPLTHGTRVIAMTTFIKMDILQCTLQIWNLIKENNKYTFPLIHLHNDGSSNIIYPTTLWCVTRRGEKRYLFYAILISIINDQRCKLTFSLLLKRAFISAYIEQCFISITLLAFIVHSCLAFCSYIGTRIIIIFIY